MSEEIGYAIAIGAGLITFLIYTLIFHKFLKYKAGSRLTLFAACGIVLEILICLLLYLLIGINIWTNTIVAMTFGVYVGYVYNTFSNKRQRKFHNGDDGAALF
ncbi:hypothetical protein SCLARK_001359 [Spiroplasma clarkii]|uniref:Uncharacterized protein n=1 Tax=Spiroplasma clarkii TaxID=2139 RepID=A0A1Y0L2F2_9MOLU|nr:hypothetical protein [Spiroplasma clarkii]ARU91888.1 hypothetical protein SCLARK_001359 [Spiroplasma clarkii]ATX71234.1 hypothetical protein SCLAR_v1c09280 [Spiroplasma clarkii]